MASMGFIEDRCQTDGCASRAVFVIRNKDGLEVGDRCRKHAPDALKAQNEREKSQPREVASVR